MSPMESSRSKHAKSSVPLDISQRQQLRQGPSPSQSCSFHLRPGHFTLSCPPPASSAAAWSPRLAPARLLFLLGEPRTRSSDPALVLPHFLSASHAVSSDAHWNIYPEPDSPPRPAPPQPSQLSLWYLLLQWFTDACVPSLSLSLIPTPSLFPWALPADTASNQSLLTVTTWPK